VHVCVWCVCVRVLFVCVLCVVCVCCVCVLCVRGSVFWPVIEGAESIILYLLVVKFSLV
jgi:hypothetical protein